MANRWCLVLLLALFLTYAEAGKKHRDHDDDDDHRPKYDRHDDDGHHDKCGDDDDDKGECGRRHWAKLMVIIGSIVLFLGIIIGVTICCVRYRKSRQQIESKPYSKKGELYIVDMEQPPPYEEKATAPPALPAPPDYPVVSNDPLPGKH